MANNNNRSVSYNVEFTERQAYNTIIPNRPRPGEHSVHGVPLRSNNYPSPAARVLPSMENRRILNDQQHTTVYAKWADVAELIQLRDA